jgi:hypothetical protein
MAIGLVLVTSPCRVQGSFCVTTLMRDLTYAWVVHQSHRRRPALPGLSLPLALISCP